VRAIIRDAAKNDYKMSSFILGVVNSPAFKMETADTLNTDDAAPRSPARSR